MSFYFIPILSSHTNNPQKSLHPFTARRWHGFLGEGYSSPIGHCHKLIKIIFYKKYFLLNGLCTFTGKSD